eukprot:GILJ01018888.1.p1 GENE.GILJ01018888.1~~GILJ01018888.1.p1  ORF type:complete len:701 (+),score=53.75 GILJ01018888.1:955-3057(+)
MSKRRRSPPAMRWVKRIRRDCPIGWVEYVAERVIPLVQEMLWGVTWDNLMVLEVDHAVHKILRSRDTELMLAWIRCRRPTAFVEPLNLRPWISLPGFVDVVDLLQEAGWSYSLPDTKSTAQVIIATGRVDLLDPLCSRWRAFWDDSDGETYEGVKTLIRYILASGHVHLLDWLMSKWGVLIQCHLDDNVDMLRHAVVQGSVPFLQHARQVIQVKNSRATSQIRQMYASSAVESGKVEMAKYVAEAEDAKFTTCHLYQCLVDLDATTVRPMFEFVAGLLEQKYPGIMSSEDIDWETLMKTMLKYYHYELLIFCRVYVNDRDTWRSVFEEALKRGVFSIVEYIIANHLVDMVGFPLVTLVESGDVDIIAHVLKHVKTLSYSPEVWLTAVETGQVDVLKLLTDHFRSSPSSTNNGMTLANWQVLFECAVGSENEDMLESVLMLTQRPTNIIIPDRWNQKPELYIPTLRLLYQHTSFRCSPYHLYLAMRKKKFDVAEWIVNIHPHFVKLVDLYYCNQNNNERPVICYNQGQVERVVKIVPSIVTHLWETALHRPVMCMVDALFKAGIPPPPNIDESQVCQHTLYDVLVMACHAGDMNLVLWIRDHSADDTTLIRNGLGLAATADHLDVVKTLVPLFLDVDSIPNHCTTLQQTTDAATRGGALEVVRWLYWNHGVFPSATIPLSGPTGRWIRRRRPITDYFTATV